MKSNILFLFMATALMYSCSNDDDNSSEPESVSIVGSWQATELVIDDAAASDDARNARDLLNFLTAKDCFVITFTFNEDLSAVAKNSINFISPTANDIPCPTEEDIDDGTYTYDGTTLTILDSAGETVSIAATVTGDILTLDASSLEIPDFNVSGELLFERL